MTFQQIQEAFPHRCVGENCAVCRWVTLHQSIQAPPAPWGPEPPVPPLRGKTYLAK